MVLIMNLLDITANTILVYLIVINFAVTFILVIINIISKVKIKRLYKKYNTFMVDKDGLNIESKIENCFSTLKEIVEKNKKIENHLNEIDRNLIYCIQKVAIIRYNAFDNTGSNLSYSVALLDSHNNGIVLTSLFSRDGSNTYGKPILAGKSKYPLSAEEIKVLNDAIKKYRESFYV
jgi:ABC-type siderophore export system fused ATPase/permease subunit